MQVAAAWRRLGRPELAARLQSAADAVNRRTHRTLPLHMAEALRSEAEQQQAALGDKAFAAAVAAGGELTLAEAVVEATEGQLDVM